MKKCGKWMASLAVVVAMAAGSVFMAQGQDIEDTEAASRRCPHGGNCQGMECSMGPCMCWKPPGGLPACYQWCHPCNGDPIP